MENRNNSESPSKKNKRNANNKPAVTGCLKGYQELIALLEQRYPAVFDWKHPKPLKKHIDEDIYNELNKEAMAKGAPVSVGRCKIKQTLRFYTSTKQYVRKLSKAGFRHDLAGNCVEALNDNDFAYATAKLQELKLRDRRSKAPRKGAKSHNKIDHPNMKPKGNAPVHHAVQRESHQHQTQSRGCSNAHSQTKTSPTIIVRRKRKLQKD